ncbi:putative phosphoribosyl transferase [Prauserella shujinwangii]|uniref:Putative phosphoribosyl transferase n=1 Tax=Prauserella shujinwangii TaxID=1453103 RepID=A0A2T0LZ20_9PSEU|nr:phosphoribosyltransferase family protein [Prauserella shujinwangii]PRX49340.1 putative phosphoribosyl transferase [Prauserella shujinwangii]
MAFRDRTEAGRALAASLEHLRGTDTVVLGLPRGGVPVAYEVATALRAPLDVVGVRKLGVPFQPELAMGAVGEGGVFVRDDEVVRLCGVGEREFAEARRRESASLDRQVRGLRAARPRVPLTGRTVVVVDDGVATGSTARAACRVVRAHGARRVVLAVPVGSPVAVRDLRREADRVVCLEIPQWFRAVGQWYDRFTQVGDAEVLDLLARAGRAPRGGGAADAESGVPPLRDVAVEFLVGMVPLSGQLTVPERAAGVVVFAHGSGSGRHSPRNRFVGRALNEAGFGTLLFDLLGHREEHDRRAVFDVALLAERLRSATAWLRDQPVCAGLPVGYFGASTGAAAALWAAAEPGAGVSAIVSRGGRPDLAAARLPSVEAPTLLIAGGLDPAVLDLNRRARAALRCENRLAVVPGATHLFEEAGALGRVARLAADWYATRLLPAAPPRASRLRETRT